MKYKAIPEWEEPKGIYIINPEVIPITPKFNTRDLLVKFYNEFLYYVIDYARINIIINDKSIHVDISVPFEKVNVIYFPTVKDIWIKDWAPILTRDEKGKTTAMKFIYSPAYQSISESKNGNKSGKLLALLLKIPVIEVPLILDGGNFTHNGEGIGIVTNRVISDNEHYSIKEIKNIFYNYLGIEKLIFIPVEPGDITGHTDGSVRFINENSLLVGTYPEIYEESNKLIPQDEYKESNEHMDRIAKTLKSELGKDFRIIRITNSIPCNSFGKNDFPPAFGNYINFVRLGNSIFLPQYNILEDYKAIEVFENNFKDLSIVPVNISGIKELSYEGGVLNCISWILY